jgi:deoxyribodipyrimidine photolyase-related protein
VPHCRHVVFVLGDQLDEHSPALAGVNPETDVVLMAEVPEESNHVWSSKARTAFFFAAMRHFAAALEKRQFKVDYRRFGTHPFESLVAVLSDAVRKYRPQAIVVVEPGDWRVEQALIAFALAADVELQIREDTHFLCSRREFADWATGYKQLRLEFFYRMMRRRHGIMMEGNAPLQGRWNFDAENRRPFSKTGPANAPAALRIRPDAITREAMADVERHLAGHPGTLDHFAWPVTRKDALRVLQAFVAERLATFGRYQDAMWTDEPFLYHSHISAAMNVKLINPREVIAAAVEALEAGHAPIEAVEGYVRQVLGWREFIRGVYWLDMPGMREANHFRHSRRLPAWYWTGDTQMNCMKQAVGQTLKLGYAHHIQRLMVTGIFGLLAEIQPKELEDWYLAVYIDAIDWVELPNVAGMALFANGGRFTSKPYIATGQYIKRMSNYCVGCRYRPEAKIGDDACPFTTLYWHFLDQHEGMLAGNPRTSLMAKNIARMADADRTALRAHATTTLNTLDTL